MTYDGVLFDMDGVLVEPTEWEVMWEASVRAFEACGVDDPPREHVEAISVSVDPAELDRVCDVHGLRREVFFRTRDAYASRAQIRAALDGGKPPYDDVSVLSALDYPLGVVSSNQQATVEFLLAHYGLAGHVEVAYGRAPTVEDVHRKKPDPYFLERAMADLGVSNPLFVGDSNSDVLAARNAGIDAAFVRRPHCADVRLPVDPAHELTGLDELAKLLDG